MLKGQPERLGLTFAHVYDSSGDSLLGGGEKNKKKRI